MILPDFVLYSRANRCHLYSGLDSIDSCRDQQHFSNYPLDIEYCFNSRGFRDDEWPDQLSDLTSAVWCIGDSFTVGIGQSQCNIWPRMLQERLQRRCINISLDGASNQWIARKALAIQRELQPMCLVVMWSYVHRRENPDIQLPDEVRRMNCDATASGRDDLENFQSCVQSLIDENIRHLHQFIIPEAFPAIEDLWQKIRGPSWPLQCPKDLSSLSDTIQHELKQKFAVWNQLTKLSSNDEVKLYRDTLDFLAAHRIIMVPQLDRARDGHHFDMITSRWIVDEIFHRWTL